MQKIETYPMKSTIFSEVLLDKADLRAMLNAKVDEALTQSFSKSGVQVFTKRSGDISLMLKEDTIYIGLPVDIDAHLSAFAKASGNLQIRFKSFYQLKDDWSFTTHTETDNFQWIEEPKADFMGLKIPIEKLSNVAINQIAPKLTQTIDDQLASFSNFKPLIEQLMEKLSKPVSIDPERNLWLVSRPSKIGMGPLFDNGKTILSSLYSEIEFEVYHEQPKKLDITVPPLSIEPFKNQKSKIHINGIFSADSLTTLLKKDMVGQELLLKNKKVKIEDIDIDFVGRLLTAKIKVSGALNGFLDASGAPFMSKNHTQILIDDFDISLTGSNIFMRKGVKLFKNKIQRALEQSVNAQISKVSQDILQKIHADFSNYKIHPNLCLKVLPSKQIYYNFELKEAGSLHLQISLDGSIQLNVSNE